MKCTSEELSLFYVWHSIESWLGIIKIDIRDERKTSQNMRSYLSEICDSGLQCNINVLICSLCRKTWTKMQFNVNNSLCRSKGFSFKMTLRIKFISYLLQLGNWPFHPNPFPYVPDLQIHITSTQVYWLIGLFMRIIIWPSLQSVDWMCLTQSLLSSLSPLDKQTNIQNMSSLSKDWLHSPPTP